MLNQLFDGFDDDVNIPTSKAALDTTDYTALPKSQLKSLLFNQLMRQAMIDNPQPSILTLAIKMVGVDGSDAVGDELSELTTGELVERIRKLG